MLENYNKFNILFLRMQVSIIIIDLFIFETINKKI